MSDECACGFDGDWWDCCDGTVYGPCEDPACGGACEYKGACEHHCHKERTA